MSWPFYDHFWPFFLKLHRGPSMTPSVDSYPFIESIHNLRFELIHILLLRVWINSIRHCCQLHENLSQNWGPDSHFEVLSTPGPRLMWWSHSGRTVVSQWSHSGRTVVTQWSLSGLHSGRTMHIITLMCLLWHSRLWSFQFRDTKLERFLAKNQLYSKEITKVWELE